ncbi:hypothetical protein BGZ50_009131 [Haplosporangium sp. Z 11]|nr:hypothetical protein BGZ50_009131 [Haplosporangium sp. Z 11]
MEISATKSLLQKRVLWALNRKIREEHVSLSNFVHKFSYINRDSAYSAYTALIEDSQIGSRRSKRLEVAFKKFRDNSEAMFWSEMESKLDSTLTSRKAEMITRAVGIRQAALDYDSLFGDMDHTKACGSSIRSKDNEGDITHQDARCGIEGLLSGVDGLTMIDGEKAGLESGKRRNMGRKIDMELSTPCKQTGRKLDLVAKHTTNKRDWFIVESLKEWDEMSTKYLRELDITLFKALHLVASHRLQEQSNGQFHNEARFFSVYSRDKLPSTIGSSKGL